MAETALVGGRERAVYTVRPLTDQDAIRELLRPQEAYAAYALGHLEPRLFPRSRYWLAEGPAGWGLVFHSWTGPGPALLTVGEAQALEAALRLHPGPRWSFATLRPEHLPVARRHFRLARERPMLRMRVDRASFQPVEPGPEDAVQIVRLRGREIQAINRLYSSEDGPSGYPARVIDEGVYYGVVAGRLASIAGTHVVAPGEGLAIVGNVFTHPRYRGLGLATFATSAVTGHLLSLVPNVYLTVDAENAPAIQVYRKLGYRVECTLYETPALRRDILGLLSGLRRFLARWRGRGQGVEVTVV